MNDCTDQSAAKPRSQTVLWIIALLLAVIATTLLTRHDGFTLPRAFADSPTMVGGNGVYAFTGPIDKNSYGLWMMDTGARTVWCYQFLPGTRKMKLVAARSYEYDRYLGDYQMEKPTPSEVSMMIDKERQIKERNQRTGNTAGQKEEDGGLGTNIPGLTEPAPQEKPKSDPEEDRKY